MEINLPPLQSNEVHVYRRRRSFCEGKNKILTKDTGNTVTESMATDLEKIEWVFLYQESLHKASHQDYHILLGSTTTMNILVSDSWKDWGGGAGRRHTTNTPKKPKLFFCKEKFLFSFFFFLKTGYTHMHSCELHLLAERHGMFFKI